MLPGLSFADTCYIDSVASYNGANSFGSVDGPSKMAIQFVPVSDCSMTAAAADISSIGSPSDNVTVHLYSDSGGVPGSLLATGSTIPGNTLATYPSYTRASSDMSYDLVGGTTYWIYFFRDGSTSDTDYYLVMYDTGGTGNTKRFSGAGWSSFLGESSLEITSPPEPTATTTLTLFLDSYGDTLVWIVAALGFVSFAGIIIAILQGVIVWISEGRRILHEL